MINEDFFASFPKNILQSIDPDSTEGFKLNPPATQDELNHLEQEIGFPIPSELALAFRFANGEPDVSNPEGILGGDYWLCTSEVVEQYGFHESQLIDSFGDDASVWTDTPQIKQGKIWRKRWLPISWGYDGRVLMIDTDPTAEGTIGQIILAEHIDRRFGIIAKSLKELFQFSLTRKTSLSEWPMV